MTDEPSNPARRGPSLAWLLLILPAGLAVGWLVGEMPVPALEPAATPRLDRAAPAAAGPEASPVATSGQAPTREPERQAPAEISQWTTLDNAIAESQRNGKPVMIDFNAEWCGPCRMMKQGVFDDWANGQAVQSVVIPVSIVDRAREEGSNPPEIESLQQRYQVDAFPTLVVFSPASGRMEKTRGYGGAERTVKWITAAARAVKG